MVALSTCMAAQAQQATPRSQVGEVARITPLATAAFADDTRTLEQAAPVRYLDVLRTGKAARLRVALADDSTLSLGENAVLRVDEYVYSPATGLEATLNLLRGALRFIGETVDGPARERVLIRTPEAILGVRGTDVWVGPIDGATGVLVVTGEVLVSNAKGRVRLGPGEGTMIGADGGLSPRKAWGEDKVRRALEMVAFD